MTREETSPFWDNSPRLLEITIQILDPNREWLTLTAEEYLEVLAPLIWGAPPNETQMDLIAFQVEQARIRQDIRAEVIEEDNLPSGTPEELFAQFLAQIDNWLNKEETFFIKRSWETRTNRIKELIRQRDEALAAALAAKARQIYPEDNTVALNLALASYQLAQTEESAAAVSDITSNPDSVFYQYFPGHTNDVLAVAFSNDGKRFVTAGRDKIAILWDLEGNELARFTNHTGHIYDLVFTPDDQYVLSASGDKTVRLWDLTGLEIQQFRGTNNAAFMSAAISSGGERIVTGGSDNKIRHFDREGNQLLEYEGHNRNSASSRVLSVKFSADGQQVLSGSFDGTAKLWDLEGNQLQFFDVASSGVNEVTFSPDGNQVLTTTGDHKAKLWDLEGNELARFEGHSRYVQSACFSPDGQYVFTAAGDNTIRQWDLEGRELKRYSVQFRYLQTAAFSPDGQWLVTGGSKDKPVLLWDMRGSVLLEFDGFPMGIHYVNFLPDGQSILTGSYSPSIRLWDLEGKEQTSFDIEGVIYDMALSLDGQKIVTAIRDMGAKLWDLEGSEIGHFEGHSKDVTVVAISADGERVLTGSTDGTTKLWDMEGNELLSIEMSLDGFSESVLALTFSPDGKKLLIASSRRLDKQVRLYDVQGGDPVLLEGHRDYVTAVAFSPDGQFVITGSEDETVRIWDLEGNELNRYEDQTDIIDNLVFSPDEKSFLSTCWEEARLLNFLGQEIGRIDGHTFISAAFSPDNQTILTGGRDRTVRLWRNVLGQWQRGKIYKLTPGEQQRYRINWEY